MRDSLFTYPTTGTRDGFATLDDVEAAMEFSVREIDTALSEDVRGFADFYAAENRRHPWNTPAGEVAS